MYVPATSALPIFCYPSFSLHYLTHACMQTAHAVLADALTNCRKGGTDMAQLAEAAAADKAAAERERAAAHAASIAANAEAAKRPATAGDNFGELISLFDSRGDSTADAGDVHCWVGMPLSSNVLPRLAFVCMYECRPNLVGGTVDAAVR